MHTHTPIDKHIPTHTRVFSVSPAQEHHTFLVFRVNIPPRAKDRSVGSDPTLARHVYGNTVQGWGVVPTVLPTVGLHAYYTAHGGV